MGKWVKRALPLLPPFPPFSARGHACVSPLPAPAPVALLVRSPLKPDLSKIAPSLQAELVGSDQTATVRWHKGSYILWLRMVLSARSRWELQGRILLGGPVAELFTIRVHVDRRAEQRERGEERRRHAITRTRERGRRSATAAEGRRGRGDFWAMKKKEERYRGRGGGGNCNHGHCMLYMLPHSLLSSGMGARVNQSEQCNSDSEGRREGRVKTGWSIMKHGAKA